MRWYLYAWAQDGRFEDWMFIDLHVVRSEGLIKPALRSRSFPDVADGNRFIVLPFEDLAAAGGR